MNFSYYYGNQADQYSFIRVPRVILVDPLFKPLSNQSKILYGVLLDRMGLSMRNGWFDEKNRVYIIYQISEIQTDLGFSKRKAIDYLAELEQFGLVEKKRRGRGLPSILYVKSFMVRNSEDRSEESGHLVEKAQEERSAEKDTSADRQNVMGSKESNLSADETNEERSDDTDTSTLEQQVPKKCENAAKYATNDSSRSAKTALLEVPNSTLLEVSKSTPLESNNNINNTYMNNTKSNPIISTTKGSDGDEMRKIETYAKLIADNLELDILKQDPRIDRELLDGIYDLILETVVSKSKTIVIASSEYPAELVRSKFLKLNAFHIQYVVSCFERNSTKVHNIKKYLLAALFNAPSTINGYYTAEVHHDMPQLAGK